MFNPGGGADSLPGVTLVNLDAKLSEEATILIPKRPALMV